MRNTTPRPVRSHRTIGTLIGNGWLREAPQQPNAWHARWDLRSKSALRKCMFLPVPEELKHLVPRVSPAALPPHPPAPRQVAAADEVSHRNDPRRNVRAMPAYVPGAPVDPRAVQLAHALQVQNAQKAAAAAATSEAPQAWWEDPVALGSLLILVPPIGLAAVWSSKRYSNDARWALTVMTALTMCLMSAVLIAALALR